MQDSGITSFANAFSLVTGTHCRACIKTIELRNITPEKFQKLNDSERVKHLYVTTFCRDSDSTIRGNTDDDYIHPIISNTDFHELFFKPEQRMYFSNDLKSEKGYQNSSLQAGKELPYRSTIAWPIRKLVYEQDKDIEGSLNQKQDIIGYLCVDSTIKNVFRKGYDFEMGATVADTLFVFLKNYHNYLNYREKNEKIET